MEELNHSKPPTMRRISKAEINELPLIAWEGRVEVLDSIKEMEAAAEILAEESHLGFDTETRPSFRKGEYYPPALVQFANADCVYLFSNPQDKDTESSSSRAGITRHPQDRGSHCR